MGATAETGSASLAAAAAQRPLRGAPARGHRGAGADAPRAPTRRSPSPPRPAGPRGDARADRAPDRAPATPTVPHLSARLVRDRAHLDELLDRLPRGRRARAVRARRRRAPSRPASSPARSSCSRRWARGAADFDAIGITGYPESHHLISDEETIRAMFAKAPMATHIVSQLCFDAATISALDRRGAPARHRPADLDRRAGQGAPREAAAGLDEDRAGRVGPLPEPPPQLDVAPGHAPVQARPPGARADPVRRPTQPPAWPASTSTRSTRWRARSAGAARTLAQLGRLSPGVRSSSDSASSVETSATRSSDAVRLHAVVQHHRAERAGHRERVGAGRRPPRARAPR